MHSDAAGMPTEAAIVMRVATECRRNQKESQVMDKQLTNVAPGWRMIDRIPSPDDRVDKFIEACKRRPYHIVAC